MTYAAELDDLRQEVRLSTATTIVWWPKIDASGNVTASATASDNTYEVRDPSGTVVQASGNVTVTAVSGVGSRFDLSIPAISTLGEDYHAVVTWKVSGETLARLETVYFDVVREPWGPSSVSLNSMQSLIPDIGDRILRQANRLSQTVETRASTIGHLARVKLGQWLRQAVSADVARLGSRLSTTSIDPSQYDAYLRPRLIKSKESLHHIEVAIAIALAYGADVRADADDGDAVAALYDKKMSEAEKIFAGLGPLKYDLDDDLTAETTISEVGRYVAMRRVQS